MDDDSSGDRSWVSNETLPIALDCWQCHQLDIVRIHHDITVKYCRCRSEIDGRGTKRSSYRAEYPDRIVWRVTCWLESWDEARSDREMSEENEWEILDGWERADIDVLRPWDAGRRMGIGLC